jgi:ribose-phosphate pyrophosphokinase
VERIAASPVSKIYVTDTIMGNGKATSLSNVEVLSVADLFGEAIERGFNNQSISSLFDVDKG